MPTYSVKGGEITHKWYVIDASGQTLGRLATRVATVLRGKHKPIYTPNLDTGDYVIIVNAEKIVVTGKKETDKIYYRHSQYPGGLKKVSLATQRRERPTRILEKAVRGMLPHNRLGDDMYRKLKVYAGPEHPHEAQMPEVLPMFLLSPYEPRQKPAAEEE